MALVCATTTTFGYIDMTTAGATVDYYGANFSQGQTVPAGTGVFDSFLRIQAQGVEQGYNTSGDPVPFDDKKDPHTHNLQLNQLAETTINGGNYYTFGLDINETSGGGKSGLSLDVLKIYTSPVGSQTTTDVNSLGTLRYNLDAHGDTYVMMDTKAGKPGSGASDLRVFINANAFAGAKASDYVYLYSQFGNHAAADGGFEEWGATMQAEGVPPAGGNVPSGGNVAAVPEPNIGIMLGLGMLGVGIVRRYQKRNVES